MTLAVVLLLIAAVCCAAVPLFGWIAEWRAAAARTPPPLFFPMSASPPAEIGSNHSSTNGNGKNNGNGKSNGNGNGRHADAYVSRLETVVPRPVIVDRPLENLLPSPGSNHRTSNVPLDRLDRDRLADTNGARFSTNAAHGDANADMETVRFIRESDVSVQLLPGRLEVIGGVTPLREIPFVRIPGEPAQITLGRTGGPSPQYVGLESPTVSRRHARFDYSNNRWTVKNLSHTNPLVVNGDELFDTDIPRPLADGDRLELGEVVLRFHAR